MHRRRQLVVFGLVGAGLLVTGAWGLSVRLPETADLSWMLAVNGPRLLLAAVVGAGLAGSGAIGLAAAPGTLREVYTLALSFGAAFGATRGLAAGFLGPELDVAIGALGGAAVFVGVTAALARTRHAASGLLGIAMFVMGVAAALAAVAAKGDPLGVRPVIWWMLGDFSRVGVWSALAAAVGILGLLAVVLGRAPRDQAWGELADERRRALARLAAVLWGVCIGAGGIIAWFGLLAALAARRLVGTEALGPWLKSSALLGAFLMTGLDAGGRFLVGGYAFPVGLAVALFAVPWFLGWGRSAELPRSRVAARVLRGSDFVLAGGVAAVVGAFVVGLTLVVSALG